MITYHQGEEAHRNSRVARESDPYVDPAHVFVKAKKGKDKGGGRKARDVNDKVVVAKETQEVMQEQMKVLSKFIVLMEKMPFT